MQNISSRRVSRPVSNSLSGKLPVDDSLSSSLTIGDRAPANPGLLTPVDRREPG
ncbi:hypothetical protein DPMN_081687 [Dreissena polymorpha]|uniref:Uncharacterized protein n=1 Tax=Dreissena polymorpha TaxID=45954 RepID=A0A9D3Y9A4_DREPO|nr:hypothetical protein DPMN_081687 [Dreissena polymorpha]